MSVCRKVNKNNNIPKYPSQNHQNKKHKEIKTTWTDDMISTHLPIYPIHYKNDKYKISNVLFESISPSINCVLLGEATHGTHEFYEMRSLITKHLILNKQFTAIFIEVDWPKVYRLNEYVLGRLDDTNIGIDELFDDLKQYPLWMYRNSIIKELVVWLKNFNKKLKENNKKSEMVTFYGIDMQCYDSLEVLKRIYNKNKLSLPCSAEIISYLKDIKINDYHYTERYAENQINKIYKLFSSTKHKLLEKNDKNNAKNIDLIHNIDQNLITLKSAVNYFNNDCLWDIRDNHWYDTIQKYFYYKSLKIEQQQNQKNDMDNKGKIILWAHNSHVFNADFTNYSHSNIGAILKNRYGQKSVFTIYFDSFYGSLTATNQRDEYPQFFNLDDNVKESYGKLLNKLSNKWRENNLMIFLKNGIDKMKEIKIPINPEYFVNIKDINKKQQIRDIGVCYMYSNPYNHCSIGDLLQIADVMIFINKSNALEPFQCDKHKNWDKNKKLWMLQNNQQNDPN